MSLLSRGVESREPYAEAVSAFPYETIAELKGGELYGLVAESPEGVMVDMGGVGDSFYRIPEILGTLGAHLSAVTLEVRTSVPASGLERDVEVSALLRTRLD